MRTAESVTAHTRPRAGAARPPDSGLPDGAARPEGLDGLAALARAGRLAEHYPDALRLVRGLAPEELDRAGRLLARVDPAAVLAAHPNTPVRTVAITGHCTLTALTPALAGEFARHGILLRAVPGRFDTYVFDLADPGSALYAARPDLTLCVLDPEIVFDDVPTPWSPPDVERVLAEKLRVLEGIVATFAAAGGGTLVLNTIPLPQSRLAQLVDYRSRALLGALWREANARLLRLAETNPALCVLDLEALVWEGGSGSDARMSVYAKAHLSDALLARYARQIGHLARHQLGATKKCLVLDLDGTVWGGILGEDGPEGVEVSETHRGEAFRAFQKVAKQIGAQGVLLAVVSKNEPAPVQRALRERAEMTLREDDFVRIVANWRPKHENLAELATSLNLGVDGFVFVDDNPAECALVRRELPGVAVVQVDGDPALHAERLLADGWFDSVELTATDRERTRQYRQELERKDFLDSFDSIQDYLRELEVEVALAAATPADLPRVSQLTLRTNQFNLTTERLTQPEVAALAAAPGRAVLTVRARDRFGDNGLVGAVFLRRTGDSVLIENFMLSCRVFSRGVEQAALAAISTRVLADGAAELIGEYRPTAKNAIVAGFYPRYGFDPLPADAARAGASRYRLPLGEPVAVPDHLRLAVDLPPLRREGD
jgi:FkbH-like protein